MVSVALRLARMRRRHLLIMLGGLALIGVGVAIQLLLRWWPAGEEERMGIVLASLGLGALLIGCVMLLAGALLNWVAGLERMRLMRAVERHMRQKREEEEGQS